MTNHNKYREYFAVNEEYFPQVNDSSIAAASPDFWMRTYPHSTFIDMLSSMERVMAQQEKRSLWIEGAYGTGKSQCAYALKKILDVPEQELRTYWDTYEPLKNKTDLLEKLIGHKQRGIVTCYRYASSGITSSRDLYLAIQDTLKLALVEANLYAGENTLKESVIAWIEEPVHKQFFDLLMEKPEWSALFSQSCADEVLTALRNGGNVGTLMSNIFRLADKEGITALNIDADRLIAWLTDVIDSNHIKVVFIWDEFSDYFKNNRESLSDFQRLAELVNLKPFYFVVVTHESGHLFTTADATWTKVRDRFISIEIKLPDNIAFDLIGHAFNVKDSAKSQWSIFADDLNERVQNARNKVMEAARISRPQVMKDIIPLHPMAALILKNIASAFKSNQRSIFEFIKSSNTEDVRAFQWFIDNAGPLDDHPLLTVDMLWNFFYEKGRDNLTSDIRLILDTFPQQQNLRNDEKAVLKAILIMQAIDQRLGGSIDLFKATEQNLSYVFEGISDLDGTKSANLARGMKEKGILVSNPISGGKFAYAAAVLAGDQARIDTIKRQIRQSSTTAKLVSEGGLSTVLSLSPALRLRFECEPGTGKITPVTHSDFTRTINIMRDKPSGWNFQAVIAFAKDEAEAAMFRSALRSAVADKQYKDIVFIDALSTPLGNEAFEQFVEHSAMASYYQSNNNSSARESADKAKRVLDQDWKNRIYNGQFNVYTYSNQEGEKLGNGQGVASILQTIVTNKYPYVFDFTRGLTETQLKITPAMKPSAKSGIIQTTSGAVVGIEKHIFPTVWGLEHYWNNPMTEALPISKIKATVNRLIQDAFDHEGQIAIADIYDLLTEKYGFAPCNLSAFIAGFLLKEYSSTPLRYSDSSGGHEPMTQDKLAEMISNHIGKSAKPTYIVKMTADEMAFYDLTEKIWHIPANSCSSAAAASSAIQMKMRNLALPVWCLEEIDTQGVFDVVQMYIELVQKEGNEVHRKAVEIGRAASARPSLGDDLSPFLTQAKCQEAMRAYLLHFEGGKVIELARSIGAEDNVLTDTRNLFMGVKHSCLWDRKIAEDEIRKLIVSYGVAKLSNDIMNSAAHSMRGALNDWRERLNFLGISHESLQVRYPALFKCLDILRLVFKSEDLLPEQVKVLHAELTTHSSELCEILNDSNLIFAEVYAVYLEGLSLDDIGAVRAKIGTGLFAASKTESNSKVKDAAEDYRKGQIKAQLYRLWQEKTGTKHPRDWSNRYRTPILSCVPESEYEQAKKAFDALNRNEGTDLEIKSAIEYLETTLLYETLDNDQRREEAFRRDILGTYATLLNDLNKVRNALDSITVDVYNWRGNPLVKNKIQQLANAEYNAGGSDRVLNKIDEMSDTQLKQYLKRLIRENVTVGMEILASER